MNLFYNNYIPVLPHPDGRRACGAVFAAAAGEHPCAARIKEAWQTDNTRAIPPEGQKAQLREE